MGGYLVITSYSIHYTKLYEPLYRVESNTFVFLIEVPDRDFFTPNRMAELQKTIDGLFLGYREQSVISFRGGFSSYPEDAGNLEQLLKNLLNLVHATRSYNFV